MIVYEEATDYNECATEALEFEQQETMTDTM
jgi:hypothetical protein